MWSRRSALLLLLPVVSPVLAGVQEVWWNITYVQDANPDGFFARRVIGINGTWPYVFIPSFSTVVQVKCCPSLYGVRCQLDVFPADPPPTFPLSL